LATAGKRFKTSDAAVARISTVLSSISGGSVGPKAETTESHCQQVRYTTSSQQQFQRFPAHHGLKQSTAADDKGANSVGVRPMSTHENTKASLHVSSSAGNANCSLMLSMEIPVKIKTSNRGNNAWPTNFMGRRQLCMDRTTLVTAGVHSFSTKAGEEQEKPATHDADGPNDHDCNPRKDDRFVDHKPTLAYAKSMPFTFSMMRHEQIVQLSAEGLHEARCEALIRNIMATDNIEYDDAVKIMSKIIKSNREHMLVHHLPYVFGFVFSIGIGIISIPLVFDHGFTRWFNDRYVTMDVPDVGEVETALEVGSWSWSWMEPVIGTLSFLLLTFQFARAQLENLGTTPYSSFMRERRAKRLIKLYPEYDSFLVGQYSRSETYYNKSD